MGEFSKDHNPETTIKRNSRDLSFSNNLTFNIGYIVPCFCKEVLSGDTFSIDTLFALNFFPTYFPIQNKIRADVHFFYCRTRNIYNEFKRFTSNVSVKKPMPYLAMTDKQHKEFKVGSIYDYFNIPTTLIFPSGAVTPKWDELETYEPILPSSNDLSLIAGDLNGINLSNGNWNEIVSSDDYTLTVGVDGRTDTVGLLTPTFSRQTSVTSVNLTAGLHFFVDPNSVKSVKDVDRDSFSNFNPYFDTQFHVNPILPVGNLSNPPSPIRVIPVVCYLFGQSGSSSLTCFIASNVYHSETFTPSLTETDNIPYIPSKAFTVRFPTKDDFVSQIFSIRDSYGLNSPYQAVAFGYFVQTSKGLGSGVAARSLKSDMTPNPVAYFAEEKVLQVCDLALSQNPFVKKPLNSSVFRCYESIYNSFFRDERNNPLLIDGEPAYDEYLTSTDGGPDNFDYKLHRRNWEQDWFTTALPTPQQGNAPLVGISSLGEVTVSTDDGQVFKAQAEYADDGDTITNVHYTPVNQDGTPMPNSVKRQLVSLATSGISINDFRNVNALQRYLETNIRRGLKYKDIMASRWGINISYAELNMPEFIGGVTEYVSPAQVNQTSQDTESSPLGSFAGQLYCKGQNKHSVRVFCDEPGYIIGLISVVPTPVYSQSLPKMFTKHSQLDFYNPEFGHIGLQPIPMLEVAPLQTPESSLDETFGYQRAWYDYLASLDEVHGQFRTSLRDFVMYRTYDSKPVLSEDFLLVSNRDVDNVFSVQRDSVGNSVDKVIGQIHFSVKTRRPIPKYGIPRLE